MSCHKPVSVACPYTFPLTMISLIFQGPSRVSGAPHYLLDPRAYGPYPDPP